MRGLLNRDSKIKENAAIENYLRKNYLNRRDRCIDFFICDNNEECEA